MVPLAALLLACSSPAPSGNDRPSARDFTPNPGQHFYGVQLLLKATGEDVVNVLDTQWELADSSGKRFTRTNFSTVDDTQPLSSAGQQLDDTVAFNVPNGANPATFKARFGEDTLTVNLA